VAVAHGCGRLYRLLDCALSPVMVCYFTPVSLNNEASAGDALMSMLWLELAAAVDFWPKTGGQRPVAWMGGLLSCCCGPPPASVASLAETMNPAASSSSNRPCLELPISWQPEPLHRIWSLDFVRLQIFAFRTITTVGYGEFATTPYPQITIGFG